jgi:hypothetical protein
MVQAVEFDRAENDELGAFALALHPQNAERRQKQTAGVYRGAPPNAGYWPLLLPRPTQSRFALKITGSGTSPRHQDTVNVELLIADL